MNYRERFLFLPFAVNASRKSLSRKKSREIRPFELMKQLGMSKSTYYRYVKRIKE